jgi:hypothetical protein
VFHSHEIRNQRNDFRILNNPNVRDGFLNRISQTIDAMPVTVIAAAIDKPKHKDRYANPANPYDISLAFCMERLQMFLAERRQNIRTTFLVVERRGRKEDGELESAFIRIRGGANMVGQMPNMEIRFMDKKHNSSGLQVADLVAYPVARYVINPRQENKAYQIVSNKFRRSNNGHFMGFGLKLFP